MVISHVIISGTMAIIHFVIMTLTAIMLYDIPNNGNSILLLLLSVLQSFSGMCCGIFVSTIFGNYRDIALLTFTIQLVFNLTNGNQNIWLYFYFVIIPVSVEGSNWPIESQPVYMRYFFNIFQFNHVTTAFRTLLFNRINVWNPIIPLAFGMTIAWIFLFLIFSVIVLRIRK
jgi:hypothetical protein